MLLVPVRVRPEKVATPLLKAPEGLPELMLPPAPVKIAAVAVPEAEVMMLPPESSTVTAGCW